MPFNFPENPINGATFSYGTNVWSFNGYAWNKAIVFGITGATGSQGIQGVTGATGPVGDYVSYFNGLTGSVQGVSAAVAGAGISVSGATGSVTISNTGVRTFIGLSGAVGFSAEAGITYSIINNVYHFSINYKSGASAYTESKNILDTDYILFQRKTTGGVVGQMYLGTVIDLLDGGEYIG